MKTMTLTAALLAATSTTAIAGGLAGPVMAPAPAPVVVAAPTTYADWSGFYVGGQFTLGQTSVEDADDSEEDIQGYGVHAGYLYDLGSYVIGAEAEYSTFDSRDDDTTDDYIGRLKGIVGYDAGKFLPYATAGFAQVDFEGEDDNVDGSFFGAGVMYQATESLRVGAEVLQHNFDDVLGTDTNLDATTASLKVSYSF